MFLALRAYTSAGPSLSARRRPPLMPVGPEEIFRSRRFGNEQESCRLMASSTAVFAMLGGAPAAAGAVIPVTTLQQKISTTGGCSLQEAIYSANFDSNVAVKSAAPPRPS